MKRKKERDSTIDGRRDDIGNRLKRGASASMDSSCKFGEKKAERLTSRPSAMLGCRGED